MFYNVSNKAEGKQPVNKTEKFIKKAVAIHGDRYSYRDVEYVRAREKVKIICSVHGEFLQAPYSHLSGRGCKECGYIQSATAKISNTEEFATQASIVHNNKYRYDKVEYISSAVGVVVICPKHGEFTQKPHSHLVGKGCPKCGKERSILAALANPRGWNYTDWAKAGNQSKNFEGFSMYLIKCTGNGESFIKVGKTFTSIQKRFSGKDAMPYKYSIIKQVYYNAYAISQLEVKIKDMFKEHKYIPERGFGGKHECLSTKCLEDVIREMEK